MVELIFGKVQSPEVDYFQKYVVDDGDLIESADSTIGWQSNILDSLCKLALKCMSSRQKARPSSVESTTSATSAACDQYFTDTEFFSIY
jgi:hypothetical protein